MTLIRRGLWDAFQRSLNGVSKDEPEFLRKWFSRQKNVVFWEQIGWVTFGVSGNFKGVWNDWCVNWRATKMSLEDCRGSVTEDICAKHLDIFPKAGSSSWRVLSTIISPFEIWLGFAVQWAPGSMARAVVNYWNTSFLAVAAAPGLPRSLVCPKPSPGTLQIQQRRSAGYVEQWATPLHGTAALASMLFGQATRGDRKLAFGRHAGPCPG